MSNAPSRTTDVVGFLSEMKLLVESVKPDLRKYMKAPFDAIVTKAHDNDANDDTYYRVDIKIEKGGEDGGDLDIPEVKVDSIWAENGYGIFALPEEGSIVTVEFDNFDIKRPHITGSRYLDGKAPKGFKAGTFAIRGKHGQKMEFKPESSEIVVTGDSIKIIRGSKGIERTGEDFTHQIDHDHSLIVKNLSVHEAKKHRDIVLQNVERNYGSLNQTIGGSYINSVGGSFEQNIAGQYSNAIAGDCSISTVGNYRRLALGDTEIIAGGAGTGQYGYSIQSAAKPVLINMTPAVGYVELGQGAYPAMPAVCLEPLLTAMKLLLNVLKTPLQLGNFGAPTAPNPAFVALLSVVEQAFGSSALTSPLASKAVFIRQV